MLTTYCPIVALDTISARSIALAAAQHSLCTLQLGDDTTSCAAAVDWMIHVVLQQLLPTLSLRRSTALVVLQPLPCCAMHASPTLARLAHSLLTLCDRRNLLGVHRSSESLAECALVVRDAPRVQPNPGVPLGNLFCVWRRRLPLQVLHFKVRAASCLCPWRRLMHLPLALPTTCQLNPDSVHKRSSRGAGATAVGAGVTDIAAVAIAAVAVTGLVATAVSAAGHSRRRSYCRECAGPQVLCGRAPLSPPLLPPSTAAHAAITAFALVLSSTSHIASAAVPTAAITAALPLARAEGRLPVGRVLRILCRCPLSQGIY
jgi:hypothetical protein